MTAVHHETQYVEPQIGLITVRHLTPAGAWLVRHRRVPLYIANHVAELAGFRVLTGPVTVVADQHPGEAA